MKKKFNRSAFVVFLVVFMCTFLTGCATESIDVSDVEVTFDERTVTVFIPEDTCFKLHLEIDTNSITTSWSSDNLFFVAKGVPHTYKLEDLVGDSISENAKITSIKVEIRSFDYFVFKCLIIAIGVLFLIIGLINIAAECDY